METTITALTLGQLIDHSLKMAYKNFKIFALPVLIYSAITSVLMHYMLTSNQEFFSGAMNLTENPLATFNPGSYFLLLIAVLLISPLFQYIVCDLSIAAFFVREKEWNLTESMQKGMARYIPLLTATVLSSLLVMAGTLVFLIGALVVALFLSLVYPIMVFEEVTARESLRRSFQLVRGEFWLMALYWMLFGLIFIGIDLITSRVLDFIHKLIMGDVTGFSSSVVYFILNAPVVIFTIAFQSCFMVNLYFNQRIKREGFGIE